MLGCGGSHVMQQYADVRGSGTVSFRFEETGYQVTYGDPTWSWRAWIRAGSTTVAVITTGFDFRGACPATGVIAHWP